jgi:hypothetical protein
MTVNILIAFELSAAAKELPLQRKNKMNRNKDLIAPPASQNKSVVPIYSPSQLYCYR